MLSAGQIRNRTRDLLLLEAGREIKELARVRAGRDEGLDAVLFAPPETATTDRLFQIPTTITAGFAFPLRPNAPHDLPRLSLFQEQFPLEAPSAFDEVVIRDESDPAAAMFEPNFADVVPVGEPLDQTRQIEEPVVAEKMELANARMRQLLKLIDLPEESFPYFNERYLGLIARLQHFTERTAPMTQADRSDFWEVLFNQLPVSSQAPQALEIGFGGVHTNIFALLDLGVEVTATELNSDEVAGLQREKVKYPGQLHAMTARAFAEQNDKQLQLFPLIVLNMPHPKGETAENILGIVEEHVAPGGFVVISTDVPFMYLAHFWNESDRWEPIMMDPEERFARNAVLPSTHLRHDEGVLAIFRRLPVPPERVVSGVMPEQALQLNETEGMLGRMWRGFSELFSPREVVEASFPVDGALDELIGLAVRVEQIILSRPGLINLVRRYRPKVDGLVKSLQYLRQSPYRAELAPEQLAGFMKRLGEFLALAEQGASDQELIDYYAPRSTLYTEARQYGDTLAKDVENWRKMHHVIEQYYEP